MPSYPKAAPRCGEFVCTLTSCIPHSGAEGAPWHTVCRFRPLTIETHDLPFTVHADASVESGSEQGRIRVGLQTAQKSNIPIHSPLQAYNLSSVQDLGSTHIISSCAAQATACCGQVVAAQATLTSLRPVSGRAHSRSKHCFRPGAAEKVSEGDVNLCQCSRRGLLSSSFATLVTSMGITAHW